LKVGEGIRLRGERERGRAIRVHVRKGVLVQLADGRRRWVRLHEGRRR
jgi:hypothetical protein